MSERRLHDRVASQDENRVGSAPALGTTLPKFTASEHQRSAASNARQSNPRGTFRHLHGHAPPREIDRVLREILRRQPHEHHRDCGLCGREHCTDLAQAIYDGVGSPNECLLYRRRKEHHRAMIVAQLMTRQLDLAGRLLAAVELLLDRRPELVEDAHAMVLLEAAEHHAKRLHRCVAASRRRFGQLDDVPLPDAYETNSLRAALAEMFANVDETDVGDLRMEENLRLICSTARRSAGIALNLTRLVLAAEATSAAKQALEKVVAESVATARNSREAMRRIKRCRHRFTADAPTRSAIVNAVARSIFHSCAAVDSAMSVTVTEDAAESLSIHIDQRDTERHALRPPRSITAPTTAPNDCAMEAG